ncbi:hypothetical protein CPAR01_09004, partial [Colletotrichum paranaense]
WVFVLTIIGTELALILTRPCLPFASRPVPCPYSGLTTTLPLASPPVHLPLLCRPATPASTSQADGLRFRLLAAAAACCLCCSPSV